MNHVDAGSAVLKNINAFSALAVYAHHRGLPNEFECVPELWDEKNSCQTYEGSSTACSMIQEIQYRKNQIRKVEVLSRVPQQLN